MGTATKRAKPKTPKPHPMAFVGNSPCANCGCEWFRPTVRITDDQTEEAEMGVACANLWCPMIAQFRELIDKLKHDRIQLAKLAAVTPQFDNPLHAWEAQALRDRLLARVNA